MRKNISLESYQKIREKVKKCVEEYMSEETDFPLSYYIAKYNDYDPSSDEYKVFQALTYFPDSQKFIEIFEGYFKGNATKMAKRYNIKLTDILERLYLLDFYKENFDNNIDIIYDEQLLSVMEKVKNNKNLISSICKEGYAFVASVDRAEKNHSSLDKLNSISTNFIIFQGKIKNKNITKQERYDREIDEVLKMANSPSEELKYNEEIDQVLNMVKKH